MYACSAEWSGWLAGRVITNCFDRRQENLDALIRMFSLFSVSFCGAQSDAEPNAVQQERFGQSRARAKPRHPCARTAAFTAPSCCAKNCGCSNHLPDRELAPA